MEFLPRCEVFPCSHIDALCDENHDFHRKHAVRCVQNQPFLWLGNDNGGFGHDKGEDACAGDHIASRQRLAQRADFGVIEIRFWQAEQRLFPSGDPNAFKPVQQEFLSVWIGFLARA